MKKLLSFLVLVLVLVSCGCPDSSASHKFEVGQDVHIKHKLSHSGATVTKQLRDGDCNCMYEVTYYSTFNTRRHRTVTEGEIEEITNGDGDSGLIDQVTDGIKDIITH